MCVFIYLKQFYIYLLQYTRLYAALPFTESLINDPTGHIAGVYNFLLRSVSAQPNNQRGTKHSINIVVVMVFPSFNCSEGDFCSFHPTKMQWLSSQRATDA